MSEFGSGHGDNELALLRAQGKVEPEGRWVRFVGPILGLVIIALLLFLVDRGVIA